MDRDLSNEDKEAMHIYRFKTPPHILIIDAPYYADVASGLKEGVLSVLDKVSATHEYISVPGALELPSILKYSLESGKKYDAYIALGCVIRGQTGHYDVVVNESMRGLYDLVHTHALAFGNGILTVDDLDQAEVRSNKNKKDHGGHAAHAALSMLQYKHDMGVVGK